MFDVPASEKSEVRISGELALDFDWSVGLIVGPSGSGKTTVAREVFGSTYVPSFGEPSVLDDFDAQFSIEDVARVCQAVGFNTIPAWLRPYAVLSTGERFRVEIARALLEAPEPIVVDEFTSVVDRQVAKITAHAVAKYVRKNSKRFVAVSCHYDVIDWLDPDWTYEPATGAFDRRSLRRSRPKLDVCICQVPYSAWSLFAPFHYLTASLNRIARCFGLYVDDRLAVFCAMINRPQSKNVIGVSRLVTLPDWQGLGLAFVLKDRLAAAYRAIGKRVRAYPTHPSYIRSHVRSDSWACVKKPGGFAPARRDYRKRMRWAVGLRPNAVFEYVGPALDVDDARRLLGVLS